MLAAVLRRKTGQNVTEFLKPRLLEPLGITSLTCALLGDGTELGGGGMKMVTIWQNLRIFCPDRESGKENSCFEKNGSNAPATSRLRQKAIPKDM